MHYLLVRIIIETPLETYIAMVLDYFIKCEFMIPLEPMPENGQVNPTIEFN